MRGIVTLGELCVDERADTELESVMEEVRGEPCPSPTAAEIARLRLAMPRRIASMNEQKPARQNGIRSFNLFQCGHLREGTDDHYCVKASRKYS
jgi:hypothetical protein